MARKKKTKQTVQVESLRHKDKRKNIPTEELRDFVKEDEDRPKTILYPRDPSLDPQLVWKGKDEQDREDLALAAVPVYIQEKIHPQAIIEDIRAEAGRKREAETTQPSLFSDFNGIDFEQMVDFYQHDQNWSNRMILGDSLLVMTSLAEKEGLKGKVQMIYIDPPYGIKFGSNWQVSTRKREVKDGKVGDVVRQPEQIKAFRDTWKLGIHSYLSYLRDRFVMARELLTETGSIFVQIGDENLHLVRCLLDEVFGSENFCVQIDFVKTVGQTTELPSDITDHILWYAKDRLSTKVRPIFLERDKQRLIRTTYGYLEMQDGCVLQLNSAQRSGKESIPAEGRLLSLSDMTSQTGTPTTQQCLFYEGMSCRPKKGRGWRTSVSGIEKLKRSGRLYVKGPNVFFKHFFDDYPIHKLTNLWPDTQLGGFLREEEKVYVVQTIALAIQRCLLMTTDPGDLVLDPTCGSGTTAYVAEQWGRRWITIDTSRVSIALARTRLMAGRFPYYLLADSREGLEKEAELTGRFPPDIKTGGDIRRGFVYKRVPHVTLKAIANNEEIDAIHEKWQPKQDAARARLNKALKEKWEEWEVPREAETKWPKAAKEAHTELWKLRRERQKEIDESIARNADQEILYDQPYEDRKRVRVTGPFTVESLSPHRFVSADEDLNGTVAEREARKHHDFETMILENLRASGVKTTRKGEGIKFDHLESYAGTWIQAEGEYTDKDGKSKRVAVCIGPEHGTVAPQLIKEAAKDAVQGVGFDVLVVCGFAFDPHVAEEATRYGNLNVMIARMNPDLAMGDELLKKTGSGNLFMVFGEPDVDIRKAEGDKLTVEIKGVDVYDPTTGQVRSNSTDDIACWFIDTNYNGESFFVRHAYFCGRDEPYDKLKRALRAEVDESAWEALYSTKSRPFDRPDTGKIAVKVINHYGDEVLKVYEV